jgi:hypothetical protein
LLVIPCPPASPPVAVGQGLTYEGPGQTDSRQLNRPIASLPLALLVSPVSSASLHPPQAAFGFGTLAASADAKPTFIHNPLQMAPEGPGRTESPGCVRRRETPNWRNPPRMAPEGPGRPESPGRVRRCDTPNWLNPPRMAPEGPGRPESPGRVRRCDTPIG